VMRSDGAGRPSLPSALAGMNVGAAIAAAVVAMKWRREIFEERDEYFIYQRYFGGLFRSDLNMAKVSNAAKENS